MSVLRRQPQVKGVRVVSGARFGSGQAGDGLENEYRADPDDEPVPEAEALIYPFTDGDSNDESEGADRPPVTNAGMRPSQCPLSSVASRTLYIRPSVGAQLRSNGTNRVEGAGSGVGVSVLFRQPHGFEGFVVAHVELLVDDQPVPERIGPRHFPEGHLDARRAAAHP